MDKSFVRKVILNSFIIAASMGIFWGLSEYLDSVLLVQAQNIRASRAAEFKASHTAEILADYKNNAPLAQKYSAALQQFLPEQEQLLDFPRFLDGIARVRGVAIVFNFQGEPIAQTARMAGYIPFSMDVNGSADAVAAFLGDVELQSARYLVAVDSADITKTGDTFRGALQGRVFFKASALQPAQDASPAAAQPGATDSQGSSAPNIPKNSI